MGGDLFAALAAGFELPLAHGLHGGGLEFALGGAEREGILDVALVINDEVDDDFAGDAGAAHFKRVLWLGLKPCLRLLIEHRGVEHLHAAKHIRVADFRHDAVAIAILDEVRY